MTNRLTRDTWREKLPPICPNCGYNLTGLTRNSCPECGEYITWSEVRQNARDTTFALRQIVSANDICGVGLYVVMAGFVVLLVCWGAAWADGPARVVAFFLALGAGGCGGQVFRVGRFPSWAAEHVPEHPRYVRGAAVTVLALALMALVIFLP